MNFCGQSVIVKLKESMPVKQNVEWQKEKEKLCTFITFKEFGLTPSYITMPMPFFKAQIFGTFLALKSCTKV